MNDATATLSEIKQRIADFARERDWERFHTPKNLACAVSVEAGELLELLLWQDDVAPERRARLEEEAADVAICLLNLCHVAGIDLAAAIDRKMASNATKYPAEKVRGSSRRILGDTFYPSSLLIPQRFFRAFTRRFVGNPMVNARKFQNEIPGL